MRLSDQERKNSTLETGKIRGLAGRRTGGRAGGRADEQHLCCWLGIGVSGACRVCAKICLRVVSVFGGSRVFWVPLEQESTADLSGLTWLTVGNAAYVMITRALVLSLLVVAQPPFTARRRVGWDHRATPGAEEAPVHLSSSFPSRSPRSLSSPHRTAHRLQRLWAAPLLHRGQAQRAPARVRRAVPTNGFTKRGVWATRASRGYQPAMFIRR